MLIVSCSAGMLPTDITTEQLAGSTVTQAYRVNTIPVTIRIHDVKHEYMAILLFQMAAL